MKRKELAAAVGVSRQALSRYAAQGCPMTTPEAVRQWRKNNKRPRKGVKLEPGETLQGRLLTAQIAKVEEEARHKKLKNDQIAGKLYDAAEVEQQVAELTGLIRVRLESIPDEMQMDIPPDYRHELTQRWRDKIWHILTEMSQFRLSCDGDEKLPWEADAADDSEVEDG